jgi:flagellar hook-basal body complex protein FliE
VPSTFNLSIASRAQPEPQPHASRQQSAFERGKNKPGNSDVFLAVEKASFYKPQ